MMLGLSSQKRNKEENVQALRNQGVIPGVMYGAKIETAMVKVDGKEFKNVYEEVGKSSLINLESQSGKTPVLIREVQREPVGDGIIHVDFYQPPLDEKIEVAVPLVFKEDALAVTQLGGTLEKHIQEVEVKALPQDLPHEIAVDISTLATFEDRILVKDLVHEASVEILRDPEDVIAQVVETKDIEAELEQPVVEDVEGVEQVKEEKKEKDSSVDQEEETEN